MHQIYHFTFCLLQVAFKSGYGKYIGLDSRGRLVGRAEAIGPREMWAPVYQVGEMWAPVYQVGEMWAPVYQVGEM